jgi:hypothetical protein
VARAALGFGFSVCGCGTGGGWKVAGGRQLLEEDAQRKELRDGRTRLGLRMQRNV